MPASPNRGTLIRQRTAAPGSAPWRLVVDIAGREWTFNGNPAPDRDTDIFALLTEAGTTSPTRGYIGVNQRKTKDVQPDIRGRVRADGTDWDLAAWAKNGKPDVWSVRASPPRPAQADPVAQPPPATDDIPLSNQDFIDIFAQQG